MTEQEKTEKIELDQEVLPEERAMFEKHGLIEKEKEEKTDKKETKQEEKTEEIKEEKKEEVKEVIKKDKTESEPDDTWTADEKAMYWKAKVEKNKRQAIQIERDLERARRIKIEKDIEELKKAQEASKKEKKFDEFGEEIKEVDEDKPLTLKELKRLQDEERKENERRLELQKHYETKLNAMEMEVRDKYEDLDSTIDLATDLFKNYKILIDDLDKQKEIESKILEWTTYFGKALNEDVPNLTELAYKIGQLHPKYKKNGKAKAESKKVDSETLTEERLKKLEEAKRKPRTSASLSGSGSGLDVDDELTYEQLKKMRPEEWSKLSQKTRDKMLGKPT